MRSAIALAALVVATLAAPRSAFAQAPCTAQPVSVIPTLAGPEDIVALPLADGRVQLFVREVCREPGCDDRSQIGTVTLDGTTWPGETRRAWRPPGAVFEPSGMSLARGEQPGSGILYVLDKVERPRIWRLEIADGVIKEPAAPWWDALGDLLSAGNDIQAVGDAVYVTRFDPSGFLPGWIGPWPGVVRVGPKNLVAYAEGFRGANGIVDLGKHLLVSDYWGRRLRFVGKHPGPQGAPPAATDALPIHPDNLTLDGDRVLIAGQRSWVRTTMNLLFPWFRSPSAVYAVRVDKLGPDVRPDLLWEGGAEHGRSVSVAVSVPGGLALGQIRTPGILVVRCASPR